MVRRRDWNTREIRVLNTFASLGLVNVAKLLDRTPAAVEAKARELGVSLRITDEDVDLAHEATALIQLVRESPFLAICPSCGQRLARMSSGLCRVCHLDGLIEIRETEMLEQARERRLAAIRQQKRRARICDVCEKPFFPRRDSTALLCPDCLAVAHGHR